MKKTEEEKERVPLMTTVQIEQGKEEMKPEHVSKKILVKLVEIKQQNQERRKTILQEDKLGFKVIRLTDTNMKHCSQCQTKSQ